MIQNSWPDLKVRAYLMLSDKSKIVSIDGLNQLFRITTDDGHRTLIEYIGDVSLAALGERMLCTVNVDDICDNLYTDQPFESRDPKTFRQWMQIEKSAEKAPGIHFDHDGRGAAVTESITVAFRL